MSVSVFLPKSDEKTLELNVKNFKKFPDVEKIYIIASHDFKERP